MANNTIQFKRTSTTGLLPNTTNAANNAYIPAGSFAVNLTDKRVHSSDGSLPFEVGANLSALAVGNATVSVTANSSRVTIGAGIQLSSNGSVGTAGQVLTSNGATGSPYWSSGTAATMNTYTFTVTSNTTVFTGLDDNSRSLTYTAGLESVFINGSRQIAGVDYNTTSSTVITLTANAINGEVVQVTSLNASVTSGGGGTPGGANTQVQFNDSGAFGASAGFTFDKTTNNVTIANSLIMNTQSISITSGANTLTINPFNMFTGVGNSFSIAANSNSFTSIFIAANGNVGIQNNTPAATLSVTGNVEVTGITATLNLRASSRASPGYAWLPNGILMQWGTVASNTIAGDVTFPTTFPTAILGVTVTPATTYIVNGYPNVIAQTTSTCNVRTGSTTSRTMFWQALGY